MRHMSRLAMCLVTWTVGFSLTSTSWAGSPDFGGMTPRGIQRGVATEVTLTGARLDDAQELVFHEPGITVTKFEVVNPTTVKATLEVAPDCQLGAHRLRIRTATGLTSLRAILVGNLPQVDEVEPNSDFKAPQAVAMNSTVQGVVQNEDVDYFVVEAKKGDRITAEVEAIRLGITLFDVYVAIMNEARFELSSSDDAALVWQDGIASIIAPEDGKYIVQVRDCSYGGNGSCLYRVHIGNFPRPMQTLPSGGKAGEAFTVKFLGDVAGDRDQPFTIPAGLDPQVPVFAQDDKGISPSPNWIRVTEFGNVLEAEPNENITQATAFAAPLALNGILDKAGDVDYFKFSAEQGQVFDVRVYARSLRSPIDSVLYIHNAQGGVIAGNDDSGSADSFLRFSVPAKGEYGISIKDHLGNGGPYYGYRIEVTPVKPALKLSVAEFQQYVPPALAIPKGGKVALMINASRIDCGGNVSIKGLNLPAGVTIEAPTLPANLTSVPVIFSAAADAPNSSSLIDLIGVLEDNDKKPVLEGHLAQDVTLIRGQNQIPFWTETVPHLAAAVTNEAPYAIEIVEPKVPIVHGGQMSLKVVATRKGDFKAPIKIDMLWLPPGINASREVSIPEGQTEALIPINAAGNAQVADWKIAIRAQANTGNGNIETCSPFATLKVSEMYLNFAFETAAVEQGKETEIVVKVTKNKDFEGGAKTTLYGLPNKAVTDPMDVTKDQAELVFKIKTDMTTPAGNHQNVFAQVVVMENGEPILHNLGGGKLRVDVPIPPKKDAPPPMPMPMPVAAKPAEAPPMKRLTRLEQLRLEQAEREKAAKAGGGGG